MRIGIDARELGRGATGVGRYLRGLLTEWSGDEGAQQHEFLLYAPEVLTLPGGRHFHPRLVPGPGDTWWEQVRLPRAVRSDHLDVFFAPAYTAALGLNVPTVVAIHDISFFAHPEWYRWREGIRRRWLTDRSAQRAKAIITISECSRREIVERLGIPDSRIRVISPGVTVPGARTSRLGAGNLEPHTCHEPKSADPPRALFVGSIFNRRHVPELIQAFGRVARRRPDASLDIVGDNRSFPRQDIPGTIAAEGLNARVRWHQYASDDVLYELYEQARAFAFLSEYEGLGLPPLEALASGIPPVVLDTPVAREGCGDAALYVPLDDLATIADTLESALFDDGVRGRVLAGAPAALKKYNWPVAARETLRVIERPAE